MTRKQRWAIAALALPAAAAAWPLAAHHSAAMFDEANVVEVRGTVKELQWTNPHVWLQVLVESDGTVTEWSIEGSSPNSLSRQGWRRSMFNPGDEVIVRLHPMKDGAPAGSFVGAKLGADGGTIGQWE